MSLVVSLERDLPRELPVGRPTAVFCIGSCHASQHRIEGLEIEVDGIAYPVTAFGMPRPDLAAAGSNSTGFWGTVPVPGHSSPRSVSLSLRAQLSDGSSDSAVLGEIKVVEPVSAPSTSAAPANLQMPTIAVCMATYEPDMTLFEAQIQSLRDQSDQGWICLISDDCSSPETFARINEVIGNDPRFAASRSEQRLGFYRNFERALDMVPATAALVALSDQDDRWHPDKLATLRAELGDATLVYSDQRLVEADGTVRRSTMWEGRSNNHTSLASMLVANTITGAAMLFRRELLDLALPFPDTPGFQFHDTWLAIIALSAGRVAYVGRPLYDYVQHPGAVFGDVTHGSPSQEGGRSWLGRLRSGELVGSWRAAYFYGYLSRDAQAQVALVRCGAGLTSSKRRELERFVACEHSVAALLWLTLRPMRALLGRTETLGSELALAQGVLWRRLTSALARHPRLAPSPLADASTPPPAAFSQKRLRAWRSRI